MYPSAYMYDDLDLMDAYEDESVTGEDDEF